MRNRKQQYFCNFCQKRFQLKGWGKPKQKEGLIREYAIGKQTQEQIGHKIGRSRKWVNQYLSKEVFFEGNYNATIIPQEIVLIVDTTYFEQFGLMVFRASNLKKNLLWYAVKHETNEQYKEGIELLLGKGWKIKILIADGKPGLGKLFPDIPFQHCQFHLFQIVTRYISKKPKLLAGKELREIMFRLKETDKESFEYWIGQWYKKWKVFLSEKTENIGTGTKVFTHQRIRQAYRAIVRTIPFLFTCYQFLPLEIYDSTTNSLDGYFSHLKSKLAVHRGASKSTQIKLIYSLIFS
ncbi:MAG: hypothetical protein WCJ74_03025 [bacterium]